eukprot:146832-Pelagomonas_calceolata.AAC.1
MPTCLLAIVKSMYANDEYVPVDGCKQARVRFHFALILELSKAARFPPCTGDVRVTHMLYADELCQTSNQPDQLQLMLHRLHAYAQRKGLVINAAKSKIVHFNYRGDNMPLFMLGGARLACADSFRYLGTTQ